jgi:hypothetical protein
VDVQYWDRTLNTAALVQRYFPLDEYGKIREVFLGHYPDVPFPDGMRVKRKRLNETRGYYIQPWLHEVPDFEHEV